MGEVVASCSEMMVADKVDSQAIEVTASNEGYYGGQMSAAVEVQKG